VTRYWANVESVVVGVNGQRLVDPAESEGLVPAVSIVVPSFTAHSLAHVLADWSAIGEMMQAGRSGEQMLAAMLHHAAEEAGCQEARGCSEPPGLPDGEEIELSIDGPPGCLALPRRMPGSIRVAADSTGAADRLRAVARHRCLMAWSAS
jgi:hypothetical protein